MKKILFNPKCRKNRKRCGVKSCAQVSQRIAIFREVYQNKISVILRLVGHIKSARQNTLLHSERAKRRSEVRYECNRIKNVHVVISRLRPKMINCQLLLFILHGIFLQTLSFNSDKSFNPSSAKIENSSTSKQRRSK